MSWVFPLLVVVLVAISVFLWWHDHQRLTLRINQMEAIGERPRSPRGVPPLVFMNGALLREDEDYFSDLMGGGVTFTFDTRSTDSIQIVWSDGSREHHNGDPFNRTVNFTLRSPATITGFTPEVRGPFQRPSAVRPFKEEEVEVEEPSRWDRLIQDDEDLFDV